MTQKTCWKLRCPSVDSRSLCQCLCSIQKYQMPIANAESINHKYIVITLACQNMYIPNKKLK